MRKLYHTKPLTHLNKVLGKLNLQKIEFYTSKITLKLFSLIQVFGDLTFLKRCWAV